MNTLLKSGGELPIRYAIAHPGNYPADSAIEGDVAATRSTPANCLIRQMLWEAL